MYQKKGCVNKEDKDEDKIMNLGEVRKLKIRKLEMNLRGTGK